MFKKVTFRHIVVLTAIAIIGLVLIGFSGHVFPIGASASVIRPQAGVLLIFLAMILWWVKMRAFALASMIVAGGALGSVMPGFFTPKERCVESCLILYQKNLLSRAWPRYTLAGDIIASRAQVVTLQEVSDHNRRFMAEMFNYYPNAISCKFRLNQDVAVLTSLPMIEGSEFCLNETGLTGVQVLAPNGQLIWVLSIHLEWPFPFAQYQQARMIADYITKLTGPVVVAGDFNMVPWGGGLQQIRKATGNRRLGAYRNTYRSGSVLLPLPIDTVLVPQNATGSVILRPYLGSDHLGVLARIDLH